MKFFVSVFLLLLSPFSVIKTVLGLNCYVVNTTTTTECESERKEAKESNERSSDHVFSKYFACVRQKMIQMQKDTPCEPGSASCATLTYELKDKTQLVIKSCEKSEPSICNALQRMNDEEFKFNNFVINSNCDFCSSEKCNNKTANDKPLLPSLPTTEVTFPPPTEGSSRESSAPPRLSCHNTDLNQEYLINCAEKAIDAKNRDHYIRKIIDCFRESISNENNEECPEEGTACTTLVVESNDQTEFLMKSCDNSDHYVCNRLKNAVDKMLIPLKKFVNIRSYCESCSSDYCNNKPAPPPRDSPEEKLYDSPSAISTFIPSATAVFVTVFIIHLLLWI